MASTYLRCSRIYRCSPHLLASFCEPHMTGLPTPSTAHRYAKPSLPQSLAEQPVLIGVSQDLYFKKLRCIWPHRPTMKQPAVVANGLETDPLKQAYVACRRHHLTVSALADRSMKAFVCAISPPWLPALSYSSAPVADAQRASPGASVTADNLCDCPAGSRSAHIVGLNALCRLTSD